MDGRENRVPEILVRASFQGLQHPYEVLKTFKEERSSNSLTVSLVVMCSCVQFKTKTPFKFS